jgi:GT2 family glycosyltransferase
MRLIIITLNWNGVKYLQPLYDTLTVALSNCKFDECVWYIADNGSRDASVDVIKGFKNFDLLEVGHNRNSFASGCNQLVSRANPADDDLILLLNNDVTFPDPYAIRNMHSLMSKTGAGVVGLRLLYMNTDTIQHGGVIFAKRYNSLPYHYRPGEKSDKNAEKNRYFQAVTAAVCLVKASSWKRVGGMDQRLRWAFDDVSMCLSIGKTEKIAYCGESFAYHEESASLKRNSLNKLFVGSNVSYFKQQWAGKYELDLEKYERDENYNVIK